MKLHTLSTRASARGLTLIELVVVLAILVALAGLIIGNFPSLLKKASGSTSANTIQDIGRAMSIRYTLKGVYPDGYDNLDKAKLPITSLGQVDILTAIPAADLTALKNVGITNVVTLLVPGVDAAATDATWNVSFAANNAPIVGGTTLVAKFNTGTTIYTNLLPNPSIYTSPTVYVFGIGKLCTLVGGDSTLLEAPARTGTSDNDAAQTFYQRYCVAFLVDGTTRKARFIGAVVPTADGFQLTEDGSKAYQAN